MQNQITSQYNKAIINIAELEALKTTLKQELSQLNAALEFFYYEKSQIEQEMDEREKDYEQNIEEYWVA